MGLMIVGRGGGNKGKDSSSRVTSTRLDNRSRSWPPKGWLFLIDRRPVSDGMWYENSRLRIIVHVITIETCRAALPLLPLSACFVQSPALLYPWLTRHRSKVRLRVCQ